MATIGSLLFYGAGGHKRCEDRKVAKALLQEILTHALSGGEWNLMDVLLEQFAALSDSRGAAHDRNADGCCQHVVPYRTHIPKAVAQVVR